jgi:hypothetical protein
LVGFAENTPRGFDKLSAWNRSVCLLSQTLDELQAKAPLRLSDPQADGWLRKVKPPRRRGETSVLNYLNIKSVASIRL